MKNKYILLFEKFLELELEPDVEYIETLDLGIAVIPGWQVY